MIRTTGECSKSMNQLSMGTLYVNSLHSFINYQVFILVKMCRSNVQTSDLSIVSLCFSKGVRSPRKDIVHNIDFVSRLETGILNNDTFDNRVSSAFRQGNWKLITGRISDGNLSICHRLGYLITSHLANLAGVYCCNGKF